jgi:very-short-patch-repair endonuclease
LVTSGLIKKGVIKIDSLELAKEFGRNHKDVLESISNFLKRNKEYEEHFVIGQYKASNGKHNKRYIMSDIAYNIMSEKFKYNIRSQRLEYIFGNEIYDYFSKLGYTIETQKLVCNKYKVDFYIESLNLVIEYDEEHHKIKDNNKNDKLRQKTIEKELKCSFIRIPETISIGEAIGIITKYILKIA